jgi:uncharacterized protein (DUF1499 family)
MSKKTFKTAFTITIVVLVGGLGRIYYQNGQTPELGVTQGRFKPLGEKPNNVSSQAQDLAKRVDPLKFKETPEATMAALKSAVESCGGGIIRKETPDYLYMLFTSPRMRFHDDTEFWLDKEKNVVHFRSAARAGYSDMGVNRRRYEKIRTYYEAI